MTSEDIAVKLRALVGQHDQTARTQAIKLMVDHHSSERRKGLSTTDAFLELMAGKYAEGVL
jgi:hypothetical protein